LTLSVSCVRKTQVKDLEFCPVRTMQWSNMVTLTDNYSRRSSLLVWTNIRS